MPVPHRGQIQVRFVSDMGTPDPRRSGLFTAETSPQNPRALPDQRKGSNQTSDRPVRLWLASWRVRWLVVTQ
ncbi:hypothetical protein JKG47_09990 [Acidithiobacillus sp. MC6.1]|nr:hypothetical protein [Acidithiobacillus sp. MC6.1]